MFLHRVHQLHKMKLIDWQALQYDELLQVYCYQNYLLQQLHNLSVTILHRYGYQYNLHHL